MSKNKDAQAAKAIVDYLHKQNRPYSATDIFSNLHKEYGKTAVVKTLEGLAEQGKIREKTYGKQKVYVADQSQFEEVDESELKKMEEQIVQLTDELQTTTKLLKSLEAELNGLNNAMSTEEAKEKLSQVSQECDQYKEKLKNLKSNANAVAPAEREQIVKNREKLVKAWRKRKRTTNDIVNAILEGYPKSKKQLYEEVGIETDEEYHVTPPEL